VTYLKSRNLAFKFLLVLDNSPRNLLDFGLAYPYIQVEYLPKKTTTSLLQVPGWGIIIEL
jgi:hypothetical protein